jgi:WD40 repeat protein
MTFFVLPIYCSICRPRHVLHGHTKEVTCVCAVPELDLVISISLDGTCIIHTLRKGQYIRTITHPNKYPLHQLSVSAQLAQIFMYSFVDGVIHAYSINGALLCLSDEGMRINTMVVDEQEGMLVCGGDQGLISYRNLHNLALIQQFSTQKEASVTSLSIVPQPHRLLYGLTNGALWSLHYRKRTD